MRKFLTIGSVALAPNGIRSGIAAYQCMLTVQKGLVWVTVEGCATDHWLTAGQRVMLSPARLVVIEADQGGAACVLSGPHDLPNDPPTQVPYERARQQRARRGPGTGRAIVRRLGILTSLLGAVALAGGCDTEAHGPNTLTAAAVAHVPEQVALPKIVITGKRMTRAEKNAYSQSTAALKVAQRRPE